MNSQQDKIELLDCGCIWIEFQSKRICFSLIYKMMMQMAMLVVDEKKKNLKIVENQNYKSK